VARFGGDFLGKDRSPDSEFYADAPAGADRLADRAGDFVTAPEVGLDAPAGADRLADRAGDFVTAPEVGLDAPTGPDRLADRAGDVVAVPELGWTRRRARIASRSDRRPGDRAGVRAGRAGERGSPRGSGGRLSDWAGARAGRADGPGSPRGSGGRCGDRAGARQDAPASADRLADRTGDVAAGPELGLDAPTGADRLADRAGDLATLQEARLDAPAGADRLADRAGDGAAGPELGMDAPTGADRLADRAATWRRCRSSAGRAGVRGWPRGSGGRHGGGAEVGVATDTGRADGLADASGPAPPFEYSSTCLFPSDPQGSTAVALEEAFPLLPTSVHPCSSLTRAMAAIASSSWSSRAHLGLLEAGSRWCQPVPGYFGPHRLWRRAWSPRSGVPSAIWKQWVALSELHGNNPATEGA